MNVNADCGNAGAGAVSGTLAKRSSEGADFATRVRRSSLSDRKSGGPSQRSGAWPSGT